MIVYGRRAVREAMRGPRKVDRIWASRTVSGIADAILATDDELTALCGSPDHQGICAQVEPYRYADAGGLLARDDAIVVALDQIQDPQNLGGVCRVAECAGRSEEHTSELQSRQYLVCRLLLEKKKEH